MEKKSVPLHAKDLFNRLWAGRWEVEPSTDTGKSDEEKAYNLSCLSDEIDYLIESLVARPSTKPDTPKDILSRICACVDKLCSEDKSYLPEEQGELIKLLQDVSIVCEEEFSNIEKNGKAGHNREAMSFAECLCDLYENVLERFSRLVSVPSPDEKQRRVILERLEDIIQIIQRPDSNDMYVECRWLARVHTLHNAIRGCRNGEVVNAIYRMPWKTTMDVIDTLKGILYAKCEKCSPYHDCHWRAVLCHGSRV